MCQTWQVELQQAAEEKRLMEEDGVVTATEPGSLAGGADTELSSARAIRPMTAR